MGSQRKVNSKIIIFTISDGELILFPITFDISKFWFYFLGVSVEQDEWRSKMIAAINRCDTSFNPDKHKICSRHFEDHCFRVGSASEVRHKSLKPGSIPTRYMPKKTIETAKPKPRKPPVSFTIVRALLLFNLAD